MSRVYSSTHSSSGARRRWDVFFESLTEIMNVKSALGNITDTWIRITLHVILI